MNKKAEQRIWNIKIRNGDFRLTESLKFFIFECNRIYCVDSHLQLCIAGVGHAYHVGVPSLAP